MLAIQNNERVIIFVEDLPNTDNILKKNKQLIGLLFHIIQIL